MSAKSKGRRFGRFPWGYRESFVAVAALVCGGLLLQFFLGGFNFYLLAWPVNAYLGGMLIILSLLLGWGAWRNRFAFWLTSIPLSVCLLAALLILSLIMGLTSQVDDGVTPMMRTGFDAMTRSWPFVIVYAWTVLVLGALVARKAFRFQPNEWRFYLLHVGLWFLLLAAGLGRADMARYVMYVNEGETQWQVFDRDGHAQELPIAIQLHDFDLEVYPPRVAIIDRTTGEVQPSGKPDYLQLGPESRQDQMAGWDVAVLDYIHQAVRQPDSSYREVPMAGSAPAAKLRLRKDGVERSGWVSSGGLTQLYMTLPLNEKYSVAMAPSEPKRFFSDIQVYAKNGQIKRDTIEVNRPLRMGPWTVYQYGYDDRAGRLSPYSSFELVYDPWIAPVYAGIICVMLGAFAMIWRGKDKRKGLLA